MPKTRPQAFTIPGLILTDPLRPIGEGKNRNARLLGRLDLLGASFHVEADQVQDVPSDDPDDPHAVFQRAVLPEDECHYGDIFNLAGGGEPFETIDIPGLPGRRFVLYVYPFCM
jgi:hypothetical protein